LSKSSELNQEQTEDCELYHSAWNNLTKIWTLPVIHALGLKEPTRFNELKRRISGISATSLTERLTQLENLGIIERKVYAETPPRVEYALTKKGWELYAVLGQLANWIKRWKKQTPLIIEPIQEVKTRSTA
jgi:DNA-binding HxlR family transcriptional regulator